VTTQRHEARCDPHPLAGKLVVVHPVAPWDGLVNDAEYRVQDWWLSVRGESWMWAQGNPACRQYAMRAVAGGLPIDDDVVYGKIGGLGYLVHVSELGDEVVPAGKRGRPMSVARLIGLTIVVLAISFLLAEAFSTLSGRYGHLVALPVPTGEPGHSRPAVSMTHPHPAPRDINRAALGIERWIRCSPGRRSLASCAT
jgi:hypothetical protein